MKLAALILAGGSSRRFGRCKLTEPLDGVELLRRTVTPFLEARLPVIVVTGDHRQAVENCLNDLPVTVVHNAQHEQGMYSSLCCGVRALPQDLDGFFMTPGDVPLVQLSTLQRLIRAFGSAAVDLALPFAKGEEGHPVLIRWSLKTSILEWTGDKGLQGLREASHWTVAACPVDDDGILLDIDTPGDMLPAQQLLTRRKEGRAP